MPETRRCMSCMHIISQEFDFCPNCGASATVEQETPFLPIGTVISGRYMIGKAISVYADGVTYIGLDTLHNTIVDIREFLPLSIVKRGGADMSIRVKVDAQNMYYDYLQSFVMLWRSLMRLHSGSCAATVKDVVVNENLTAYAIIEHIDCVSLKDYIFSQSNTGRLTWNKAKALLLPALPTLEAINSLNIIHRAISPSTLLVSSDGRLIVSGFCIPQLCNAGSLPEPFIFDGYAPIEQYDLNYSSGTWTDVYSFTAVLYNSLTGLIPPKSVDRVLKDQIMIQQDVSNSLPAYVIKALFNGLRIQPQERIQSITQLRLALVPPAVAEQPPVPPKAVVEPQQPVEEVVPDDEPEQPVQEPVQAEEEVIQETEEAVAPPPQQQPPQPQPPVKKRKSSGAGAFIGSVFVSLIIFATAFLALYPTVLYNYIEFEQLDDVYSAFAFLPMNSEETTAPETTTAETTTEPTYVKVADFKKLSYVDISQNEIFKSKYTLKYEFVNRGFDKNVIIDQSIPFKETVLKGTEIVLTVSLGKKQVMLPSVIGMTYSEAKTKLTELGFTVKLNRLTNDGSEKQNEVYTMSPVAGIEYDYASVVTLNVWGKSSEQTTAAATTTSNN